MKATRDIIYHGRRGKPVIHLTKDLLKPYIMVRKKGGGVKRLYLGTANASKQITSGLSNLLRDANKLIVKVGKVKFKKKK